jgi:hypothetical protein
MTDYAAPAGGVARSDTLQRGARAAFFSSVAEILMPRAARRGGAADTRISLLAAEACVLAVQHAQ